jgi:nucleotide-binding universal stress UspA family protein
LARRSGCIVVRGGYLVCVSSFSRILVPVDLSEQNAAALRVAAGLARADGAGLTLLHVVEEIDNLDDADVEGFYASLTEKAQRTLGDWARAMRREGVHVDVAVARGKRAREVVRYAEDAGSEGALGTLSHQVALLAGCSVLLVRAS